MKGLLGAKQLYVPQKQVILLSGNVVFSVRWNSLRFAFIFPTSMTKAACDAFVQAYVWVTQRISSVGHLRVSVSSGHSKSCTMGMLFLVWSKMCIMWSLNGWCTEFGRFENWPKDVTTYVWQW